MRMLRVGFGGSRDQCPLINVFAILNMTLMPMFICLLRSISFDLLVDMVWHSDLHSRSYSILSFTYHASRLHRYRPFAFYGIAAD